MEENPCHSRGSCSSPPGFFAAQVQYSVNLTFKTPRKMTTCFFKCQHLHFIITTFCNFIKNIKHIQFFIIEDACGGSSPHPQTTRPSNLRVLCGHLYLPEARQVDVKAAIITMTFAVNFSCQTKRMLQQMQKSMKK